MPIILFFIVLFMVLLVVALIINHVGSIYLGRGCLVPIILIAVVLILLSIALKLASG